MTPCPTVLSVDLSPLVPVSIAVGLTVLGVAYLALYAYLGRTP